MTLKTQRNKYITFMLIYTLIALSVYVGILAYLY
jgi:predicted nucleic acid-binding Zn ribbon protein